MNLKFHSQRSNYVAYMSRHTNQMILDLDYSALHSRNEDTSIEWEPQCIASGFTELWHLSSSNDVTESIETDKDSEEIDFGDEESDIEKDMEQESDNEN